MKFLLACSFLVGFSTATISSTDEGLQSEFLHLLVQPNSKRVHYVEVYLEAPGYIDLSALAFATVDDGHDGSEDVAMTNEMDDLMQFEDDWSSSPGKITTYLDVAVVYLPDDCPTVADHQTNEQHCDFKQVGIGRNYSPDYGVLEDTFWCCTDEEVLLGICDGTIASFGRIMMNLTNFYGSHRYVEIPPYGRVSQQLEFGRFEEVEYSGKYAVVFANCHETAGREVVVVGDLEVKSSGRSEPNFHVAMKSFAEHSLEKMKELQKENKGSTNFHFHFEIGGLTLAWMVLGVVILVLLGLEGRIRRLGRSIAVSYNSLELSQMDGRSHPPDNYPGYVPITADW